MRHEALGGRGSGQWASAKWKGQTGMGEGQRGIGERKWAVDDGIPGGWPVGGGMLGPAWFGRARILTDRPTRGARGRDAARARRPAGREAWPPGRHPLRRGDARPRADVNGDGVLTFADITVFGTVYNGGTALRPGDTGYDPDADLSGSGSMGFFDYTAFTGRYGAYAPGGTNPSFNAGWIDNPSDPSGPDNSIGYDGYVFDLAGATESTSTGLYMVRHRVYDPKLGRWLERDPAGYVGGATLSLYGHSTPAIVTDPYGLRPDPLRYILRDIELEFPKFGGRRKRCTEWETTRTGAWTFVKSEYSFSQPINLPAPDVSDLIITLLEEGGAGDTDVTTWHRLRLDRYWDDHTIFEIWRRQTNRSGYYQCRCFWDRKLFQSRECSRCGVRLPDERRTRTESKVTRGVLALSSNRVVFCHCPKPGASPTLPKPPGETPPVFIGD